MNLMKNFFYTLETMEWKTFFRERGVQDLYAERYAKLFEETALHFQGSDCTLTVWGTPGPQKVNGPESNFQLPPPIVRSYAQLWSYAELTCRKKPGNYKLSQSTKMQLRINIPLHSVWRL